MLAFKMWNQGRITGRMELVPPAMQVVKEAGDKDRRLAMGKMNKLKK